MKILLMNQFFWPDSAPTSQLLTDVARGLEERGHTVSVICADGAYALENGSGCPPVNIRRVKALPFVRGAAGRILSYGSFYIGAALAGLFGPRPDLVLTLTTPPLLSAIGTLIKKLRGSKHFIWEMDVYPDVAVALNYFEADGLLDKVSGFVADRSRRQADGILALGPCMRSRLAARGISAGKIQITENWADGHKIQPKPLPAKEGALNLLYSGNLGLAHDTETILAAMRELKDDARFNFTFAGGGQLQAPLKAACELDGVRNAAFRSYSPQESFSESLAATHIGLVTQRSSCLGLVVPSKVYGLLAAGRPVLYIGPAESTVAQMIERFRCGWHVECEDTRDLVELLKLLANDRSLVEAAGQRARGAFLDRYDLPLGVSRICDAIGAAETGEVAVEQLAEVNFYRALETE